MPDRPFDPDHPSCERCVRWGYGPKAGRLFYRCAGCAGEARDIRNAQLEERRTGGPS